MAAHDHPYKPRFWLAPGVIDGPVARIGWLRRAWRALRRWLCRDAP